MAIYLADARTRTQDHPEGHWGAAAPLSPLRPSLRTLGEKPPQGSIGRFLCHPPLDPCALRARGER